MHITDLFYHIFTKKECIFIIKEGVSLRFKEFASEMSVTLAI